MKRFFTAFLTFAVIFCFTANTYDSSAATTRDVNEKSVYLKQNYSGTCTLISTVNMMRRYAMMRGDKDWQSINEYSVSPYAWTYSGMRSSFTYPASGGDINVCSTDIYANDRASGLRNLLKEHPEGLAVYDKYTPHAVLLTDYTDGVFYCADSAFGYPRGRIPLSSAYGVRMGRISSCWYVAGDKVELTDIKARKQIANIKEYKDGENRLEPTILGDVNLDGKVDALDSAMALKYASGSVKLDPQQKTNASVVSGNAKVTAADVRMIFRYTLKLEHNIGAKLDTSGNKVGAR